MSGEIKNINGISADAEILKSKLISMGIQGKLTQQLDSDGTAEELFDSILESLPIPLPPLAEQKRIAQMLDEVLKIL